MVAESGERREHEDRRQRWIAGAAIALLVLLPLAGALWWTTPEPEPEDDVAPARPPSPAVAERVEEPDEPPSAGGPWRHTADGEVWSPPVIATLGEETMVLVGDDGGTLHALDVATGSRRWTYEAVGPLRRAVGVADERAYLTDAAGTLHAIDLGSGSALWTRRVGAGATAPGVPGAGTKQIFVGHAGGVLAVGAGDGRVLWRRDVGAVAAAPAVSAGRVVAAMEDGRLLGLGVGDGRPLWTFDTRSTLGIAPRLAGRLALALTDDGRLLALDADRGLEIWRAEVGEFVGSAPAVDAAGSGAGSRVILGGGDGALRAYDLRRGFLLWRRSLAEPVRGTPYLHGEGRDETVWVQAGDHFLAAVRAGDGRPLRLLQVEGWISSRPAVVGEEGGERLVFATSEGSVHGVPADLAGPAPGETVPAGPAAEGVRIAVDPAYRDPPPRLAWQRDLGAWALAAPAVAGDPLAAGRRAGGEVVVVPAGERLVALAAGSGEEAWSVRDSRGGTFEARPGVARPSFGGERILAPVRGSGDGDGAVHALDAGTGEILWTVRTGGPVLSTPVSPLAADAGVGVFGSHDTRIYGVDLATGVVRWREPVGGIVESSPALVPAGASEIAVVGSCDGAVHGIDARTGRRLWRFDAVDCVLADVRVEKGVAYVGDVRGNVYALDPVVGGELWRFATGGAVGRRPAVDLGMVYVTGADHRLRALGTTSGHALWSRDLGGPSRSGVAVDLGIAYAGSHAGALHAVNAVNGEPLWRLVTGRPVHDVTFAAGVLYAVDGDRRGGAIYALSLP